MSEVNCANANINRLIQRFLFNIVTSLVRGGLSTNIKVCIFAMLNTGLEKPEGSAGRGPSRASEIFFLVRDLGGPGIFLMDPFD